MMLIFKHHEILNLSKINQKAKEELKEKNTSKIRKVLNEVKHTAYHKVLNKRLITSHMQSAPSEVN